VTVAVFSTAALTGNAGVKKQTVGDRAQIVSLQKQVKELRNELICLDTIAGNGVAADGYWAAQAASGQRRRRRSTTGRLQEARGRDTGSEARSQLDDPAVRPARTRVFG
jgi:hypothetical protein